MDICIRSTLNKTKVSAYVILFTVYFLTVSTPCAFKVCLFFFQTVSMLFLQFLQHFISDKIKDKEIGSFGEYSCIMSMPKHPISCLSHTLSFPFSCPVSLSLCICYHCNCGFWSFALVVSHPLCSRKQ